MKKWNTSSLSPVGEHHRRSENGETTSRSEAETFAPWKEWASVWAYCQLSTLYTSSYSLFLLFACQAQTDVDFRSASCLVNVEVMSSSDKARLCRGKTAKRSPVRKCSDSFLHPDHQISRSMQTHFAGEVGEHFYIVYEGQAGTAGLRRQQTFVSPCRSFLSTAPCCTNVKVKIWHLMTLDMSDMWKKMEFCPSGHGIEGYWGVTRSSDDDPWGCGERWDCWVTKFHSISHALLTLTSTWV
jgi:hypothetical protein